MALHRAQMPDAGRSAKASRSLKPGKAREALQRLAIGRQRVGLVVGDHLQPVLDPAQETVGVVELGTGVLSIQPPSASAVKRRQRVAAAQFGMAAAGDQLLGLHEEFDLADAAAAELDVVAFDRDVVVPAIGVDLPLHRLDVGDRGEVEVLAPDERRQAAAEYPRPAAISPAQARALIMAARSQFWPTLP